jgi:flagellar protein FliO/FliZ
MAYQDYLKFFFALVFVLALMGGLAYIMKRLGWAQNGVSTRGSKNAKRLKVIETLQLDARRRAVIIQHDNTQHLVLLGASGETVVETNIKVPKEAIDATKH